MTGTTAITVQEFLAAVHIVHEKSNRRISLALFLSVKEGSKRVCENAHVDAIAMGVHENDSAENKIVWDSEYFVCIF